MVSWKKSGTDPDYRFSLANERTYLAWMRTSIAILAGAIAIDQLSITFSIPSARIFLPIILCIFSSIISFWAYFRWVNNEKAMRHEQALSYTKMMSIFSLFFSILSIAVILLLVLS